MKEFDFLPEWYKESKRRRSHMHRQYIVLTGVFLAMLTYNLVSEHRIAQAGAAVSRLAERRAEAETVLVEFNRISQTLAQQKAKADVIQRVDSRIDADAVLAEISHVINDRVILSRLELISERVGTPEPKTSKSSSGSAVRAASKSPKGGQEAPLGDVRFKVVLVGVAVDPEDVSTLLARLDESVYFQRVTPSFSKPGKLVLAPRVSDVSISGRANETYQVTDFEITCYLANFEEIEG